MSNIEPLLSRIYLMVTIICCIYLISTIVRFIAFIVKKKLGDIQRIGEEFDRLLKDWFLQDKLAEVEQYAKKKLESEPNNITALIWLIRVSYKRNESTNTNIYAEKIINIDPTYSDYVKSFHKTVG
jgi:hypothetical protein